MSKMTKVLLEAGVKLEGYFYLHTNGDLIYKPAIVVEFDPEHFNSNFVVETWGFAQEYRECAWTILVEALALGANIKRIKELQQKWGCTNEDAVKYAEKMHLQIVQDGTGWIASFDDFVNIQESQCGSGDDCLEAFADLAKQGLIKT